MKQSNKKHKGHKKKQNFETNKKGIVKCKVSKQNKQERKRMLIEKRKKSIAERRRIQKKLGSLKSAPLLIAIVPLAKRASPLVACSLLVQCMSNNEVAYRSSDNRHLRVNIPSFHKHVDFFCCPGWTELQNTVDICKMADWIIYLCPTDTSELSTSAIDMVAAINTQGVFASLFAVMNSNDQFQIKKDIEGLFHLPEDKLWTLNNDEDGKKMLRHLCLTAATESSGILGLKRANDGVFRIRPGLLIEKTEILDNGKILRVHGYLRHHNLLITRPIHLLGWGDYSIVRASFNDNKNVIQVDDIENKNKQQEKEDLQLLRGYRFDSTLSCQNSDDDDEDDDDMLSDEDGDDDEPMEKENSDEEDEESSAESTISTDHNKENHVHFDEEDGDNAAEEGSSGDEEDDVDEDDDESLLLVDPSNIYVNAPVDRPARERFTKYFGLPSIKKTEIALDENVPEYFDHLVKFNNYTHTRHRLRNYLSKQSTANVDSSYSVPAGQLVTLDIVNCPAEQIVQQHGQNNSVRPLCLFGLLACESVYSVTHMSLVPTRTYSDALLPLRSKEPVVIQMGFRRFLSRPVFSREVKHTDRFLFCRFMPFSSSCFATICAPIMLLPSPVLIWRPDDFQSVIATGNVATVNPDIVILKRILLRGLPFKVQNTSVRVRGMFNNPEDVEHFKEVPLVSKFGDEAKILESVGTHGHMKCRLRKTLKRQSPLMMALYKRQFPVPPD